MPSRMAVGQTVIRCRPRVWKAASSTTRPPAITALRGGLRPGRSMARIWPVLSRARRMRASNSGVISPWDQPVWLPIRPIARTVPDEPTASCQPRARKPAAMWLSAVTAWSMAPSQASAVMRPSGKWASVVATDPICRLWLTSPGAGGRARSCGQPGSMMNSVEPPPMSISSRCRPVWAMPWRTPSQISRASSSPGTTSMRWPMACSAAAWKSARSRMRRKVLVATTRTRSAGIPAKCWRRPARLSRAWRRLPASSEPSGRKPAARRTLSRCRCTGCRTPAWKLPSNRWKLFEPRSTAASRSPLSIGLVHRHVRRLAAAGGAARAGHCSPGRRPLPSAAGPDDCRRAAGTMPG